MPNSQLNSRIRKLWETGQLYILLITLVWVSYVMSPNVGIYDWHKELAYFDYINDSLVNFHMWPYFWWQKLPELWRYPAIVHTSNFISNPETMFFSPLIPLLTLMKVVTYIKLMSFAYYLVGLAGILALRRRLKWNDQQFRTYLVLFLFSPIVIQHLAIGYTPWLNLFFFPWLIYFLFDRKIFPSALCLAAILALVLLQGGTHVFWWFVVFTALFSVFAAVIQRKFSPLVKFSFTQTVVIGLSFIRLYASAQSYAGFQQDFVNGYHFANFLTWAILPPVLLPPVYTLFVRYNWDGVPSWDGGIFWGLALGMTLGLLFRYRNFRKHRSSDEIDKHAGALHDVLLISSLFLLVLSFFSIYEFLIQSVTAIIPIPFLAGLEKYPFRFAIPAFLGLSVLLAQYSTEIWNTFDRWLIALLRTRNLRVFGSRSGRVRAPQMSWHAWYEIMLAGPMFLATIMWLMLAVANPADLYPVQTVAPPAIVLSSAARNQPPLVTVTPEQLILQPVSPRLGTDTYVLTDIPATDSGFLEVVSGNAALSESGGKLAFVSGSREPIVVKFRSANYVTGIVLTAVVWIGLLVGGSVYFLYRKTRHA